ncbi:MAG: CHAT domain-containing protein, partial [Akkermansiaceae bacterium]|nr:CHAT domain-containing protein [Akkermansiaceae bacterium]
MSIEDPAALLQEIRQLEAELRSSADPLKSVRLKGLQERYHRATGREAPALATQQCSHNVTIIGGQGNVTAVGGGTAIGAITLTPPTSPSKENSEPPDATKGRVDLLILAANPLGSRRLDVEGEAEAIWKSLEPHSWRIKVVIETTPAQLDELLNLHQPRFLHFSGHGNPDGTLSFLDASKREHTVAPDRLAAQLQALGLFPELIFLNACYSHAAADALAGQTHWILGMTNRVSDDTARALSPKFYQA